MSTVLMIIFVIGILPALLLWGAACLLVSSADQTSPVGGALARLDAWLTARHAAAQLDREHEELSRSLSERSAG